MKKLFTTIANGFIVPNLFSVIILWISRSTYVFTDGPGVIFSAEFIVLPILMGIMSAWFWRNEGISSRKLSGWSVYNLLIAIALSFIFLGEGSICLIIVSPLLFCFQLLGAHSGDAIFAKKNDKLNVSIVAALIILFVADGFSKHYYVNEVSDQVVINAPVAKVWPYVVAYDRIKEQPKYWLFNIGMPSPVQSTATAYKVGAGRKCIFSNGYTFDEKIVTYEPNRNLTFDIINQPRDPEIMGHIDILRGQFLLHDNGNGTTTVTGNSWYRLYVFPAWYYDLWAQSITRNVHLRVMEHIKQLCER
jgi:uncharacterized protein YndB with AHSA1/START domain